MLDDEDLLFSFLIVFTIWALKAIFCGWEPAFAFLFVVVCTWPFWVFLLPGLLLAILKEN